MRRGIPAAWARPCPVDAPKLEVRNVTAHAPDGSRLLDDVSFTVEKGWLVAVAGPTGAGKTSLVRALIGSLALESGEIRLDGRNLDQANHALRQRVGYVPQDDLLHQQLGLRRTLEYAASLRLPGATSASQRSSRVLAVLAELGLERQASLAVGSLSGGQRKRANLAVELLARPDVLVLDEPTSGLDPGHERSVMTTLREIADRGRTVLTVTHSVSALALCDRVVFLAAGGQVAFFGTPEEAVSYFALSDPAEVFVALNSGTGQSWKERWRAQPLDPASNDLAVAPHSHQARPPSAGPGPSSVVPRWTAQLLTLIQRYLDLIRSDRRHVAMLALQGPLLGLLLWAVIAPDGLTRIPLLASVGVAGPRATSVAAFLAISVTWLGTASAVREIVKEHSILKREKGAGLSLNAYVTSKVVVLGTIIVIQAALFTVIACARQGPPAHGAVLGWGLGELLISTALVGLAAVALGLLLSALVSTPDKAMTVLPIALVAQLILSGAWGSLTRVPGVAQLSDLSGAHWGLKAIDATVAGNAGAWWSAILTLACLTAGTLVITAFLVQRRLHPEWTLSKRRAPATGGLWFRRQGLIAPLIAVSMIIGLTGTAEVGLHLTQLDSTKPFGAAAALNSTSSRHPVVANRPAAHAKSITPSSSARLAAALPRTPTTTAPRFETVTSNSPVTSDNSPPSSPASTPVTTGSTPLTVTPPTFATTPSTSTTPARPAATPSTTPATSAATNPASTATPAAAPSTTPSTTPASTPSGALSTSTAQAPSSLAQLILAWARVAAAAQRAGFTNGGTAGSGK